MVFHLVSIEVNKKIKPISSSLCLIPENKHILKVILGKRRNRMEYLSRNEILNELQNSLPEYIEKFDLDSIGIFEEHGEGDRYYLGYTVSKGEKTYHVHLPYTKSNEGNLTPLGNEWTVETDEPNNEDRRGFDSLESVFEQI